MAPGNSVRNKSRKLTAELTSSRRQKLTRGKYKNKLMYKQTKWARGCGSVSKRLTHDNYPGPLIKTSHKNHPLTVLQLGSISLVRRLVLIPHERIRKSVQTQSDQAILHIQKGYRLDLPQNEDVTYGSNTSLHVAQMCRLHHSLQ